LETTMLAYRRSPINSGNVPKVVEFGEGVTGKGTVTDGTGEQRDGEGMAGERSGTAATGGGVG
jgi:hypothetical protein